MALVWWLPLELLHMLPPEVMLLDLVLLAWEHSISLLFKIFSDYSIHFFLKQERLLGLKAAFLSFLNKILVQVNEYFLLFYHTYQLSSPLHGFWKSFSTHQLNIVIFCQDDISFKLVYCFYIAFSNVYQERIISIYNENAGTIYWSL